ncbi:hypothetical protein QBC35DRAFT_392371 [Podospora australis]|uniref:Uncharacterized protein n=1 Tax=Podospora australis TaxID=1536484 RepID=A0AAN6WMP0_9PEZI|nr:hypothetical protein QBC35DRAFT_392371 [Podospora australis]
MTSQKVTGWTEDEALNEVRKQLGPGELHIDTNERECVAAIVDFDGPDGIVTVDGNFVTGRSKIQSGKYLYITSKVFVMGEFPSVQWIYKTGYCTGWVMKWLSMEIAASLAGNSRNIPTHGTKEDSMAAATLSLFLRELLVEPHHQCLKRVLDMIPSRLLRYLPRRYVSL